MSRQNRYFLKVCWDVVLKNLSGEVIKSYLGTNWFFQECLFDIVNLKLVWAVFQAFYSDIEGITNFNIRFIDNTSLRSFFLTVPFCCRTIFGVLMDFWDEYIWIRLELVRNDLHSKMCTILTVSLAYDNAIEEIASIILLHAVI